ncbi:MAG TPA: OmpA family protein, partial [Pseudomonadota bacterium]|nr:OmpA family protein [Pseudomonadota bacterium]
MYRVVVPRLLLLGLALVPALADAQPLSIPVESKVAAPRKDRGDGLCATIVHVQDPAIGQVPFSSVDDALGSLNQTSSRLTEDARTSRSFSLVNFKNNEPVAIGDFSDDVLFPYSDNAGATPPGNDRNFAVRLRGYINVDAEQVADLQRTIGLFADDGARLQIGGALVTTPDVDQRLSSRRIRQVKYGAAGLYPIELVYYQNGSNAVLELSQSSQWVPENTKLTNLHDLGFTLIGAPRPNLFVNTELYTARAGSAPSCVECRNDASCGKGNYCVRDFGPTLPDGLCQECNVASHCGPDCRACDAQSPICYEGGCVQCLADSDCAAGDRCNLSSRRCETPVQDWRYVGGCSTSQGGRSLPAGLLGVSLTLVALALLRARRRRRQLGLLLGLGLLLVPLPSRAELAVNTQTFHPAIGAENIITVEGSRTGQRLRPILVGLIEYAHRPLRLLDNSTGNTLAETIRHITTLHMMGGFGLTRWLALSIDLPVVLYQSFDRATPISDVPVTPAEYGLGDVRVVGKARLIDNSRGGLGLAFVPQFTFPSGDGRQFRGDDAYGIEPRFALDYRSAGGAIVALNLGFLGRTRDQQVRNVRISSQVRYGLGMYVPLPEGFGLMGEFAGGTSVVSEPQGPIYSPLEGHVGGRWVHASGLNLNLGTGMGFTDAVGSPKFRFFASLGYLPVEKKREPPPPATAPLTVEKAGSGSGLLTSLPGGIDCGQSCSADYRLGTQVVVRALPSADSRFVGWSGPCSGTGECVVSLRGPTHLRAEFAHAEERRATVSVEKEGEGLGEVLSEPSGLSCGKVCSASYRVDQEVRFIAVPAKDARFAGWEGACSGVEPCSLVIRGDTRLRARFIKAQITVKEKKLDLNGNVVHFETAKAKIDIDSFHLLDEVVLILREHPDMRLRIEGHTDAVPFNAPGGNLQLSKDRAAAVLQYLVDHGITGARLSSEGYGDRCPVATNQSPEGRQANRRTEFLIIDLKTGEAQRTPCVTYTPAPKASSP